MSGAALLRLQDEINSGGCHCGADPVCLVTDDGENIFGRDYAGRGGNHVRQQRLASDFMQYFWKLRLEARTLAGRHDGDRDARRITLLSRNSGRRQSRCWLGGSVGGFLHSPHYTLRILRTERRGTGLSRVFETF